MDDYEMDGDYDDYDEYGYFYVEDSYAVADELAENAVPDPPCQEFLEHEYWDLDPYDYWMETEYDEDPYYDISLSPVGGAQDSSTGAKRKRTASSDGKSPGKKRKTASGVHTILEVEEGQTATKPVVFWQSAVETYSIENSDEPYADGPPQSCALLADWRERLKDSHGFAVSVPDDVSADAVLAGGLDATAAEGDEEEWSDDDEMEEGIDPESLKSALATKLSSSGLGGGIDQEAFMRSIMKMVSGDSSASMDDIVGELATTLLNQASEGGAASEVTQWLTGQGVSIPEEEKDDDEQSINDEKLTTSGPTLKELGSSPGNSGISTASVKPGQKTTAATTQSLLTHTLTNNLKSTLRSPTEEASPAIPRPPSTPRKLSHILIERKSASPEKNPPQTTLASAKKQKKVSFAVPEEMERADASMDHERTTRSKSQAKTPETDTTGSVTKAGKVSRKRKASVDEEPPPETRPKRQLRNFAAPTASSKGKSIEPPKRTTRSAKEKK